MDLIVVEINSQNPLIRIVVPVEELVVVVLHLQVEIVEMDVDRIPGLRLYTLAEQET